MSKPQSQTRLLDAAKNADWLQVVRNGGPHYATPLMP